MGGEYDGGPGVAPLAHNVVQLDARGHVEPGGGLVQEEHLRIVGDGKGQGQTPLLPSGEAGVLRGTLLREAQAVQQVVARGRRR